MKITKRRLKQIIKEELRRETRKLNPRRRRSRRLAEEYKHKYNEIYESDIYDNPRLFLNSKDGQEYFAKNPSSDPEGDVKLVAGIMDDQEGDFDFRGLRHGILHMRSHRSLRGSGRKDPQQTSILADKGMDKKQAHEEALRLFPLYQAIYDFTEMTQGNEYHFEDGEGATGIQDYGMDQAHDWEPPEYNEEDEEPLYFTK